MILFLFIGSTVLAYGTLILMRGLDVLGQPKALLPLLRPVSDWRKPSWVKLPLEELTLSTTALGEDGAEWEPAFHDKQWYVQSKYQTSWEITPATRILLNHYNWGPLKGRVGYSNPHEDTPMPPDWY